MTGYFGLWSVGVEFAERDHSEMEDDHTRDVIGLADGQEVEIKAQCCYKIIPGFFSHGTPWTQGGC